MKRLITVEQTFTIRERGIIVAPEIAISELKGARVQKATVLLKCPGGSTSMVEAQFVVPFDDPPPSGS